MSTYKTREPAWGGYEIVAATWSITSLKGMFGKAAKPVSIEEMNEVIVRRSEPANRAKE